MFFFIMIVLYIYFQFIRRPKKTLTIDEDSGATFDPMKYIKK